MRVGQHAARSAATSSSTSASECAADSEMRSLAVPCGTVGGRIAGTKIRCDHNRAASAIATSLSPTTSAWIGVEDGSNRHGESASPPRRRSIDRASRVRLAVAIRYRTKRRRERAGEHRRRRGREHVRPRDLHHRLDDRRMRAHERAGHTCSLAERSHADDALAAKTEMRERAASLAQHAEAVRIVDDQPGIVRLRELEQRRQRRDVAVHREHGVGRDDLAPRASRRSRRDRQRATRRHAGNARALRARAAPRR